MASYFLPYCNGYINIKSRHQYNHNEGYVSFLGSYFDPFYLNTQPTSTTPGIISVFSNADLTGNSHQTPATLDQVAATPYDNTEENPTPSTSVDLTPVINDINSTTKAISDSLTADTSKIINNVNSQISGLGNTLNSGFSGVNSQLSAISKSISTGITDNTNVIDGHIDTASQNIVGQVAESESVVNNNLRSVQGNILDSIAGTGKDILSSAATASQQILTGLNLTANHTDVLVQAIGNEVTTDVNKQLDGIQGTIDNAIGSIENFIGQSLQEIVNALQSLLQPLIDYLLKVQASIQHWWETVAVNPNVKAKDLISRFEDVVNKLFKGEYNTWHEFISEFGGSDVSATLIDAIFNAVFSIPLLLGTFNQAGSVYSKQILQLLEAEVTPELLTSQDYILAYNRGYLLKDKLYELLGKHGLSSGNIDLLIQILRPVMGVGDLKSLLQRGFIDDKNHDNYMRRLGFQDGDILEIKKLYDVIPPVNDLIRFTVREVFTPNIATKYGLFEDYPDQLTGYAKQQGLTEQWAKSYWASHWNLPSIGQAFDMFHRGTLTQTELTEFLRVADVMPYWRDKIIGLSYNLVSRIDLRRMFKAKFINRDELKRRYSQLGFSPQDSETLTNFAELELEDSETPHKNKVHELGYSAIITAYKRGILNNQIALSSLEQLGYGHKDANLLLSIADYEKHVEDNPDRTKQLSSRVFSQIYQMYKKRSISKSDATQMLTDLGYSDNEITIELSFADLEQYQDFKDKIISELKQQYFEGLLQSTDLVNLLNYYGFSSGEIDTLINEIDVIKSVRNKKPGKADIDKFLAKGLITLDQYRQELLDMGFNQKYVDLYTALHSASEGV